MLKRIFAAVIVLTCFAGCKTKSALNFNQDFVKKEQLILPETAKTEKQVQAFFENKQYDSIGAAGARMEKMVDDQLQAIKQEKTPDVTGAEDFKKAFEEYFSYIKSCYTAYKNFGYAKSEDERNTILEEIRDIESKRLKAVQDIKAAQLKYASANNFRVEDVK